MGYRMMVQMQQAPDTLSAPLIEPESMALPIASMAMPKQVLTPEPGQLRGAFGQMQSWLGRSGLRRAG